MTEAEILKLSPDEMTADMCKNIWVKFYLPSPTGADFDHEAEQKLIEGMQPETRDFYLEWKADYDQSYKEEIRKFRITTVNGVIVPKEERSESIARPISAKELLAMDIPELEWLVEGMLPKGVVGYVVAPPKSYKSYMCLDIGISICNGDRFFMKKTNKTEVLYFDLESTKRRPRDRLKQILGDAPCPDGFYFFTDDDFPKLNDKPLLGGKFEEIVAQSLADHPDIGLVVVDVFQKIRRKQDKSQNAYEFDYEDMGIIKGLASQYNVTILLVHHTRKMRDSGDSFNNISGSTAILGASDFVWMIDKEKRTDDHATLCITGRDIESAELRIRFNKDTFHWEYEGTPEEVLEMERRKAYGSNAVVLAIKKLLSIDDEWSGTARELKKASHYLGKAIYDDVTVIGKTINEYGDLLHEDGIQFTREKSNDAKRERIYVFTRSDCP